MKLITILSLAALAVAVPSVDDTSSGVSLANDVNARDLVSLDARSCTPACKPCERCTWCGFGKPCCRRISAQQCSADEAYADANAKGDSIAITKKESATKKEVALDTRDFNPAVRLHPRACNPPCGGCSRCTYCNFGSPCCRRLSKACGTEASGDAEQSAATNNNEKRTVEPAPQGGHGQPYHPPWECTMQCPKGYFCVRNLNNQIMTCVRDSRRQLDGSAADRIEKRTSEVEEVSDLSESDADCTLQCPTCFKCAKRINGQEGCKPINGCHPPA